MGGWEEVGAGLVGAGDVDYVGHGCFVLWKKGVWACGAEGWVRV